MTDKELRTLDEMLTNLEIWSTWNKTFANEMIGICSKMRNLLANRKTEPTISKMEQVDEPQTPYDNCQSCLHWVYDGYWYCECNECRYEPKDEPQTDCAWK